MYRVESLPISIPIGRQGENHAMKIEIDCSSFLAEWPQATITAMLRRSVAENPYILVTSIDSNGILTWEPTAHDTGIEGDGQIEIRAVENDVLAKSVTAIVCVERSLTPPEPDTPIDWVEDIKSDIAQSVTSAANSASDAAKSAASAQESAAAAAGSAAAAEGSATAATASASAASKSAVSAATSADAASGSASEAAQSAAAADTSAKASAASAAEAAGTLDSVKASADAAAASARAAAESASGAASSKSSAAQAATAAAGSASAASTSASDAAKSAAAASESAAAAAASKTGAESAANAAKSEAGKAAASATAADTSAQAAAGSAAAAAESAQGAAEAAKVEAAKIIQDGEIARTSTWSSQKIVDQLHPEITASGNPAVIENALEGYPMSIKASWEPKQDGSGTPSPDNVRPIKGRKEVKIEICGKNLLNWPYININANSEYTQNGITYIENIEDRSIKIRGVAESIFGATIDETDKKMYGKIRGSNMLYYDPSNNKTFIYPLKIGRQYDTTIYPQLEIGSKSTKYEKPITHKITRLNLITTIYGGEVDAVTGAGTKQWEYIASYAGETLPGEWISDRDEYAAGATPTVGAQVAYKLATPVPFTATGGQTALALAGTNVIITDADALTIGGVKPLRKPIDDTRVGTDNVWSAKHTADTLLPMQKVTGNPVVIETLEGYPLELSASWAPKQEGSGTPSPDNVRPITGTKLVTLRKSSKNLLNPADVNTLPREAYGLKIELIGENAIRIKGAYGESGQRSFGIASLNNDLLSGRGLKIISTVKGGTYLPYTLYGLRTRQEKVIALQTDAKSWVPGTAVDMTIKIGVYAPEAVPAEYQPYAGTQSSLTLPHTIYGGIIDAITGQGQETWGYIASYAGETLPGEWISDRDEYAAGATPTVGAQVAYKLATPVPFTATGGQTTLALAGTNAIITDADTLTATAPTPPQTTASAAEAQAAKLDYVAMMADVDVDDLTTVDDAGTDSGMDMPTGIEGSETDGK